MEISQFTYFQQVGGIECKPVSLEITYGLERLATYVQKIDNIYDIKWDKNGTTYGDIFLRNEKEQSDYNFNYASPDHLFSSFNDYEKTTKKLIEKKLVIPAYEQCIKASHCFNLLDSRGVISAKERQAFILRIRTLVYNCCSLLNDD